MQWSINVAPIGKLRKCKRHAGVKFKPRNKRKMCHHRVKQLEMCLPCALGVIGSDFLIKMEPSKSISSKLRSDNNLSIPKVRSENNENNEKVEERQCEHSRANQHIFTISIYSGASRSIMSNQEMIENKRKLDSAKEFSAGGNDIRFDTMGSLNKAFKYLPLPKDEHHCD